MRKDYVCTPCEYRTFLLLTTSSNVGDRINSIQKSGDQSDRRDVISGERVAVILSYRINDKQKIRNRAPGFFLSHHQTGRYQFKPIRSRNVISTWYLKSAEECSERMVIHDLVLYSRIANSSRYFEFIYFCNYLIENNAIKIQTLVRYIYM